MKRNFSCLFCLFRVLLCSRLAVSPGSETWLVQMNIFDPLKVANSHLGGVYVWKYPFLPTVFSPKATFLLSHELLAYLHTREHLCHLGTLSACFLLPPKAPSDPRQKTMSISLLPGCGLFKWVIAVQFD